MFVQTFPGKFTQQEETSKQKNIFLFVHLALYSEGENDGKDSSPHPIKETHCFDNRSEKGKSSDDSGTSF